MSTTRRHFIEAAGLSTLAPALHAAAQTAGRKISANDTIQLAIIGAGGMGSNDVQSALAAGGTKLIAAADVYDGRLAHAKETWGQDVFTTRDYREVLARPEVDAVIIGAPDHWHAQLAIDAMKAGKDVYVEKPMVQKWEQGQGVVDTAKETGRILQVGSQRVSSLVYAKAKELIKQGVIGKVNLIEAWWDRNSSVGAWNYYVPTDATPATIDWDRFLGQAPKRPFEPVRLFRWRNFKDYGTGVAGDLFVHLFSGMHYIMDAQGPTKVTAMGGQRFWTEHRDVPDVLLGLYDYPATNSRPGYTLALRVNFVSGAGESSGFRFVGDEGILTVGNGVTVSKVPRDNNEYDYTTTAHSKAEQAKYNASRKQTEATTAAMRSNTEEKYLPPQGYNDHRDHHKVWVNAIRTRQPVVEDASFGLRAAGPAVLSNIAHAEGKVIQWDPTAMKRVN